MAWTTPLASVISSKELGRLPGAPTGTERRTTAGALLEAVWAETWAGEALAANGAPPGMGIELDMMGCVMVGRTWVW